MKFIHILSVAGLLLFLTAACSDNISEIGSSVNAEDDKIEVDSIPTATLPAKTLLSNRIYVRTILDILGDFTQVGYGSLQSDFMTQMYPIAQLQFSDNAVKNNDGIVEIDSMVMRIGYLRNSFLGDSITPMQLSAYELTKSLQRPLFSDVDVSTYCDFTRLLGRRSYTTSDVATPDSLADQKYKYIKFRLNDDFTHRITGLYRSMVAGERMTLAKMEPYFKGIYVTNTYGKGSIIRITTCQILAYYRVYGKDSNGEVNKNKQLPAAMSVMGVASDIINVNRIVNRPEASALTDTEHVYLNAPAGTNIEIDFEVDEIADLLKSKGDQAMLNYISLDIKPEAPLLGELNIAPPPYLLFVRESEADEFFRKEKLPDGINTFVAVYYKGQYAMPDLSGYINNILKNGGIPKPEDSKILLIPVMITLNSQDESISSVANYINSPALAKIKKSNIKRKVVYTVQGRK